MRYLVQYSVNYSLYIQADTEDDAITLAMNVAEKKWDRSVSQMDAAEQPEGAK